MPRAKSITAQELQHLNQSGGRGCRRSGDEMIGRLIACHHFTKEVL